MVAKNGQGDLTTFPIVESVHRDNILHEMVAPTAVDQGMIEEAERIARVAVEAVSLSGILGVEMFLTKTGGLYVNELAPRLHNSGRYSIGACSMSQFGTHIRGICGWPLGEKVCPTDGAVMVDVLGKQLLESHRSIENKLGWQFCFYGKK